MLSIVGWTPVTSVHPSSLGSIAEFRGEAYFGGATGTGDAELWTSDGTIAGTALIKDILPGSTGSYPQNLVNVNGTLFFTANDGVHGTELWKSDGTAAGTVMVKDILAGSGSSSPFRLTNINNTLFFSVQGLGNPGLWKSDGTSAGTVLVKDIGQADPSYTAHFTNVNGTIFFPGIDQNGIELWKSDGTTAGTAIVKDLNPGQLSSYPRYLTNLNGKLFFGAAVSGSYGMWKSDGTANGTTLIKTFTPADPLSTGHPSSLLAAGGQLYFTLPDSASSTSVWRSDGTTQGTVKLGGAGAPHDLVAVGTTVYFFDGPSVNPQLWKITPSGGAPQLITSVGALSFFSWPTAVDNSLYFTANDGTHGLEVWKSDGTASGTGLAIDALAGPNTSTPERLANIGGKLFFVADDGTDGRVLWASVNVNDAPRFFKGANQSVTNAVGAISINNWALGISAGLPSQAGQTLTFQLAIDNPGLFAVLPSIDASGRLTYTPAAGAIGTATITVTLHDNGGTANGGSDTSPPQSFTIAIRAPGPRHNLVQPLDVTGDGKIVAADALNIINYLNSNGPGPADNVAGPPYYDTSADDFIAANDALLVINYINQFGAAGEGESPPTMNVANGSDPSAGLSSPLATWQLLAFSGSDTIELPAGKRRLGT